ncbi:E3 ubiquitin-protein ligase XIAP-like isoform X2 [Physella acuta]|uniref:E3 ubiquitin-protein ligase XIAP-like isoform X2 n=1 Tax=Physella acuta TaxID=109671 RepID=UPI0027DB732D|nr:E3 ubiquitin-protein ligase XIAP-like isoform X2 [Physella acuta]
MSFKNRRRKKKNKIGVQGKRRRIDKKRFKVKCRYSKKKQERHFRKTTPKLVRRLDKKKSKKKDDAQVPLYNVQTATRNHPVSIQGIPWILFNNERQRLITYVKYPERGQKSVVLLANHGFVYTGEGNDNDDRVTCYSCCSTKQDWLLLDDVAEIHGQMSPGCSMVTHINSDNIPMSTDANLDTSRQTGTTQQSTPTNTVVAPTSFTSGERQKPTRARKPTYSELGIIISKPKSPEYALKSKRVTSYEGLPQDLTGTVEKWIDSGFYYLGYGQCVRCFHCGGRLKNCGDEQQPDVEHAKWFLNCDFIRQRMGHGFVDCVQELKKDHDQSSRQLVSDELNVRLDAVLEPLKRDAAVKAVVEMGYNVVDAVAAAKAVKERNSIISADALLEELQGERPRTIATRGIRTGALSNLAQNTDSTLLEPSLQAAAAASVVPAQSTTVQGAATERASNTCNSQTLKRRRGPTYEELGIITDRPKHPEFVSPSKRQDSFASWPRARHQSVDDLKDSGFYYAGYGDCARCFYCGGGLRNWKDEDDVYVEHARYFPKCAFIRQRMGQGFVDIVQQLNKDSCKITRLMVEMILNESNDEQLMQHPAVQEVVEMGYSIKDVKTAARIIEEKGAVISADGLLNLLINNNRPRDQNNIPPPTAPGVSPDIAHNLKMIRTIKEQNNQLRQQTVCKICMDQEVAVIFLPCGHLASCADCASSRPDCPICKRQIRGSVRVFMQ